MSTETTIFVGVAIYLAVMLVIGVYASRRAGSTTDFIVSGRRLPLGICSLTLIATWFGGGPMMGAAGAAYKEGLLGVIADPFGGALVMFLSGFFFVRLFRRLKLLTFVEFFSDRFGTTAGVVASAAAIIAGVGWTGGLLVAFGFVFESLTGIPVEIGIVAGALVVFVYTSMGGMWAVALTDFVQVIVLALGLVLLLVVVLIDVGGWSAVASRIPRHTFRLIPLEHTPQVWLTYLRMWLIFGLADVTAQPLLQRAMSARNEQVAQNSFYLAGAGYLSLGMIPVLLGIIASVTLPGLTDPETVIPTLALTHLHPVLLALFVGALLAAIMSSADSALLANASILSVNLLPLVKPDASDRLKLQVTRFSILVFGVVSLVVALKVRVVYALIVDANSLVLVSVAVPFIAGVWWKKANRTGALAGMTAGFLTWLTAILLAPDYPADLLGLFACLLALLVVTPLTQTLDPPRFLRDSDGRVVELKDRLGILPLFRRAH